MWADGRDAERKERAGPRQPRAQGRPSPREAGSSQGKTQERFCATPRLLGRHEICCDHPLYLHVFPEVSGQDQEVNRRDRTDFPSSLATCRPASQTLGTPRGRDPESSPH